MGLLESVKRGDANAVRKLLEGGDRVNEADCLGWTALHHACFHDRLDNVRVLIDFQADVNATANTGWTPLHLACRYSKDKSVPEFLHAQGADPLILDNDGRSILHLAAANGNLSVISFALQFCDVNATDNNGRTPLHYACRNSKDKSIPEFLHAQGAEPLILDNDGESILHWAAVNGNLSVISFALQFCDVNATTNNGCTPLHLACCISKDKSVPEFLHAQGADPLILGNNGSSILHLAAEKGNLSVISFALRFCDVNLRNEDGKTPLHWGVTGEASIDAFQLLLDAGADPDIRDNNNKTVIDIVERIKWHSGQDVIDLLRRNSKNVDAKLENMKKEWLEIRREERKKRIKEEKEALERDWEMEEDTWEKEAEEERGRWEEAQKSYEEAQKRWEDAQERWEDAQERRKEALKTWEEEQKKQKDWRQSFDEKRVEVLKRKEEEWRKLEEMEQEKEEELLRSSGLFSSSLSLTSPQPNPSEDDMERMFAIAMDKVKTEMAEQNLCSICMEVPKNTSLDCGHIFCRSCSNQVSLCPTCRKPIHDRRPVYL